MKLKCRWIKKVIILWGVPRFWRITLKQEDFFDKAG